MAESTFPTSAAERGTVADRMPPVGLPDARTLSEAQVRGHACVWCTVTLTTSTATDLGVRDAGEHGSPVCWFPRACQICACRHFYRALLDHSQTCEQCADDPSRCVEGIALRRMLKEVRR
ncbi:hypothetical protein ACFQ0X_43525 [Streptomyces rectiviolaceus]|uniref:hypothetical protein n=1 Tax=Streptomyces rectiviolaceus TaxID=332591 RepID=UPI00363024EE